ncbi:MAG: type II toxin-antitoxin system Phd/YefM family antitoxin [Vicinamibacterales bacterium]
MTKPKSLSRRPGAPPVNYVGAAQFKATCLELLDRVRESGEDIVVTKHGKPVAKVVRYDEEKPRRRKFIGSMKGTVLRYDRPFDPIDGEWDVNKPGGPLD